MRSRRIILLSHCILNVNSKVEGFEPFAAMVSELVDILSEAEYGIIQLPCPELLLFGMRRWGVVKEQLSHEHAKKEMRKMIEPIIFQIKSYFDAGYKIPFVIGIDGSPSCGVNLTCRSDAWRGEMSSKKNLSGLLKDVEMVNEKGIFMEILESEFEKNDIEISFIALNESNMEESIREIKGYLEKI